MVDCAMEKTASSNSDRREYIAKALAAAVAAAGIGAAYKSLSSDDEKKKTEKRMMSSNAIVIPIVKKKFLEGLPTPDELEASRSEAVSSSELPDPTKIGDVDAMKKDILRNSSRKFDFFRKAAEDDEDGENTENGRQESATDEKEEGSRGDGEEGNERIFLRDPQGRFTSQTDPLAVEQTQKEASGSNEGYDWGKLWDIMFHPIETAGVIWDAAKNHPVKATAASLGSFWLAGKISEAINSARKERAEQSAREARERYASLLEHVEGSEKKADGGKDPRAAAGAILGASVLIPAAISAMVMNRILINRREEKRLEKERSDSYPDDPVILYKTSEGKDIEMSPEAALAVIAIKRAMICSDYDYCDGEIEKEAQDGILSNAIGNALANSETVRNMAGNAIGAVGGYVSQKIGGNPLSVDQARDKVVGLLTNDDYSNYLADLSRTYYDYSRANDDKERNRLKAKMYKTVYDLGMSGLSEQDQKDFMASFADPSFAGKLDSAVKSSRKLQDHLANKYSSRDENSPFVKHRNEMASEELGRYFTPGSWIHKVLMWIMNTFGIAGRMAANKVNSKFNGYRAAHQVNQPASPAAGAPKGRPVNGIVIGSR